MEEGLVPKTTPSTVGQTERENEIERILLRLRQEKMDEMSKQDKNFVLWQYVQEIKKVLLTS